MIGHGERLKQLIDQKYSSISSAAICMNKGEYKITSHQLYALIRGQWPTEYQVLSISKHFEVEPECFLFGRCDKSKRYSYLMEGLSPNMQKMADDMNEAMLRVMADHQDSNQPRI